jgi:predicted nuclease with TOPRIM domain
MQTSVDLKNQCKLQEEECLVLDQEQKKVNLEMIDMRNKVDTLGNEKALLEAKLAHFRRENDDLEAFLSQVDPLNPNPTSTSKAASSNN